MFGNGRPGLGGMLLVVESKTADGLYILKG